MIRAFAASQQELSLDVALTEWLQKPSLLQQEAVELVVLNFNSSREKRTDRVTNDRNVTGCFGRIHGKIETEVSPLKCSTTSIKAVSPVAAVGKLCSSPHVSGVSPRPSGRFRRLTFTMRSRRRGLRTEGRRRHHVRRKHIYNWGGSFSFLALEFTCEHFAVHVLEVFISLQCFIDTNTCTVVCKQ